MFTVLVKSSFKATHQLNMPQDTEEIHEHQWNVTAAVEAEKTDEFGLAIDFHRLKDILDHNLKPLSAARLEDNLAFAGVNASAENVAKHLFISIKKDLEPDKKLKYIEVTEAPGCAVRFSQ